MNSDSIIGYSQVWWLCCSQGMGTNPAARCCPSMELDRHQGAGDKTDWAVGGGAQQPYHCCNGCPGLECRKRQYVSLVVYSIKGKTLLFVSSTMDLRVLCLDAAVRSDRVQRASELDCSGLNSEISFIHLATAFSISIKTLWPETVQNNPAAWEEY